MTTQDAVPLPCPMCSALLTDASASGYHYHPANDCIFSGFEVSRDDVVAWNRRTPATQADHIAGQRNMVAAVRDVIAERRRQVEEEGRTPERDDEYRDGQMAAVAGYYALACAYPHERDIGRGNVPTYFPWDRKWWKPTKKRRNLVKAGALILAEIERIDRAAPSTGEQA